MIGFIILLLGSSLIAGPVLAQWSASKPTFKSQWETCRIETSAYTGSCKATVITLKDGSLNIHFDVDDTGLRGLTWGISIMPPKGSDVFPVLLTAERFGERSIRYTSGECRVGTQEIFCISHDGLQLAVARNRLAD
jgi:hypothetical protein